MECDLCHRLSMHLNIVLREALKSFTGMILNNEN